MPATDPSAEKPVSTIAAGGAGAGPTPIKNGLTFWPIPEFDGPAQVFGAQPQDYFDRRDLPKVPREFEEVIDKLFFEGGRLPNLAPEVDRGKAMAAVRAWLSSWAPAHEAKVATAAYALWLWSTPAALSRAAAGEEGDR